MTTALPAKDLPSDVSYSALFSPNIVYSYFEHVNKVPFKYEALDFSIANAWWLCEASFLGYVRDEAFVQENLARAGLPRVQFFNCRGTQCYVAHNAAFILVAFRGTERDEFEDIRVDLKFTLMASETSGKVHRGFKNALDAVWPDLSRYLSHLHSESSAGRRRVWMTGHSMGGALAVLAGARFVNVQGIYTFGCPRVGNARYRRDYPVRCYRVVNHNDIVPHLPPPLFYRHVGKLIYIDRNGRLHVAGGAARSWPDRVKSGLWYMYRIFKKMGWKAYPRVLLDPVMDHAPVFYATHLWNALVENERSC